MDHFHPPPSLLGYDDDVNSSGRAEIIRVSNGFLVTIHNPPPAMHPDDVELGMAEEMMHSMVDVGIAVNKSGGAAAHRGLEEEADQWKKEEGEAKDEASRAKAKAAIAASIEKAKIARFERLKRQREYKPVETFVCTTFPEVLELITKKMGPPKAK